MSSRALQVRDAFFDMFEQMMAKLYACGQDLEDSSVPSSFVWRTPKDIPGETAKTETAEPDSLILLLSV